MNEKIQQILKHPVAVPTITGVVSFAVGVGVSTIFWRREIKKTWAHKVQFEEVDPQLSINFDAAMSDVKRDIFDQDKAEKEEEEVKPKIFRPAPVIIDADKLVTKDGEEVDVKDILDDPLDNDELVRKSIFAGTDSEWDLEKEIKNRTSEAPYILHKDEFYSDELGYHQSTLTYYAGDNIMVDQENTPIYNFDQLTGPLNFGHGSGDPNVVYVRNDKNKAEYEIIYDQGHYAVEVLGMEMEDNERARDIRHSEPRKFRSD